MEVVDPRTSATRLNVALFLSSLYWLEFFLSVTREMSASLPGTTSLSSTPSPVSMILAKGTLTRKYGSGVSL